MYEIELLILIKIFFAFFGHGIVEMGNVKSIYL